MTDVLLLRLRLGPGKDYIIPGTHLPVGAGRTEREMVGLTGVLGLSPEPPEDSPPGTEPKPKEA